MFFFLFLPVACKDLLTAARDGKLNTFVQISVAHPTEQTLTRYANTEIVEVSIFSLAIYFYAARAGLNTFVQGDSI